MAKEKHQSLTPATQWLKAHKIPFEEKSYEYVEHGGTALAASSCGLDHHQVIKTLIMEDEHAKPLVILMHGDAPLQARTGAAQFRLFRGRHESLRHEEGHARLRRAYDPRHGEDLHQRRPPRLSGRHRPEGSSRRPRREARRLRHLRVLRSGEPAPCAGLVNLSALFPVTRKGSVLFSWGTGSLSIVFGKSCFSFRLSITIDKQTLERLGFVRSLSVPVLLESSHATLSPPRPSAKHSASLRGQSRQSADRPSPQRKVQSPPADRGGHGGKARPSERGFPLSRSRRLFPSAPRAPRGTARFPPGVSQKGTKATRRLSRRSAYGRVLGKGRPFPAGPGRLRSLRRDLRSQSLLGRVGGAFVRPHRALRGHALFLPGISGGSKESLS